MSRLPSLIDHSVIRMRDGYGEHQFPAATWQLDTHTCMSVVRLPNNPIVHKLTNAVAGMIRVCLMEGFTAYAPAHRVFFTWHETTTDTQHYVEAEWQADDTWLLQPRDLLDLTLHVHVPPEFLS